MAKHIDTARVAAVRFSAVKFLATESRKESTACELACFDSKGVFLLSATMPLQVKRIVVEAGTDEKVVTEQTVRVPYKGLWNVAGLQIQEGDRNVNALRVYGDFDVTGPSSIELLTRKDVVDVNPF
jgi:hypothetical protein